MNLKPLRWSAHISESLAAREIPKAEAERALADPERVEAILPDRAVYMRRHQDARLGPTMPLRVVVEENGNTGPWSLFTRKVYGRRIIVKATYDQETDTITITLREERNKESDEVRPGVIADFGYDAGIVRFEILDASKVVSNAREMQFAIGG
jgi:hypothetical protein